MSIETPFRFGVRDLDTRVSLSTIYASISFGRSVYVPTESTLPSQDDTLKEEGVDVYLSTFDDASGTTHAEDDSQQTSVAGIYTITKDTSGPENGVLFLTLPAQASQKPYEFQAALDLSNVSTGTKDYTDFSDYAGVVLGIAYWPENTGVFLFFRGDGLAGGTGSVTVAGPSDDGTGTRPMAQTTALEWKEDSYTFTINVDPSPQRRKVLVFATDSNGDETSLAEFELNDFNEFLPSVRMGTLLAEDEPTDKVTFIAGLDGFVAGEYIDVYSLAMLANGHVLVVDGLHTGSSTLKVDPTESQLIVGPEGAGEWIEEGDDGSSQTTEFALQITASSGPYRFHRDEPDLGDKEWMILGRFAGDESVHEGIYHTGMGITVSDGTSAFKLHLLDDFSRRTIGISLPGAADDTVIEDYKLPEENVEWDGTEVDFILLGSGTKNLLRLYTSDTDLVIDHIYADSYPLEPSTEVAFGFTEDGEFSGEFHLYRLWLFTNCTFYEPTVTPYPPTAQGWGKVSNGLAEVFDGTTLEVDATASGAYGIYHIDEADHDETSGAALFFRMELESWRDSAGAVKPTRKEFGPVAAIRTSSLATQLHFVQTVDGVFYAYFSNDTSDVTEVLKQSDEGRLISAEVDLSEARTFLLDVKPRQWIRLYVDNDTTPVIEIDWDSEHEGALRSLPTNMPVDAVVAFGSLGEDSGVKAKYSFARASLGRGYDLTTSPVISDSEPLYGAQVSLLIDVQDED